MGSLLREESDPGVEPRARSAVRVQIEANARYATEYWPAAQPPMRLRTIHKPAAEDLPGDLGHLVDARTAEGELLPAIVLARASAHLGAVVTGQIVGMVAANDADQAWLLVVPEADRWLAVTRGPAELPREVQPALCLFLKAETLTWIDSEGPLRWHANRLSAVDGCAQKSAPNERQPRPRGRPRRPPADAGPPSKVKRTPRPSWTASACPIASSCTHARSSFPANGCSSACIGQPYPSGSGRLDAAPSAKRSSS